MVIAKVIPKPRNWQDFEKLCKKLFGEMWGCPHSIKANGRSGQAQSGVDIYGVPNGKERYWGVQCKGKDDYLNSALSAAEIDEEIAKARTFEPPLEEFIVATTASKDVRLEEHVRKCDLSSRKMGGFAVRLLCWEDLADLIEESRQTFNWWVRERRHQEYFDCEIAFPEGAVEGVLHPRFNKVEKIYSRPTSLSLVVQQEATRMVELARPVRLLPSREQSPSWCPVEIYIQNSGREVIEDYRVEFWVEGLVEGVGGGDLYGLLPGRRSVSFWDGGFSFRPIDNEPLVQEDSRRVLVYVLPSHAASEIGIGWKIFARDFSKAGKLMLRVEPEFRFLVRNYPVEAPEDERTVYAVETIPHE